VSAVLDAYYAALKAGDVAALRDVVAEDVVVTYHGRPGLLPWTGVWRGFDAYRDFLGRIGAALEILEVTPAARVADGARVIVLLDGRWRARATGRVVAARVVNIFTLRDGRVAGYEVFHDTAALWEALRGQVLDPAGG
jgi:ketosteroid isomerase-like protein